MARLVVGPFNRVEGDLEVRLEVAGGIVRSAEVVAPMYRGFEAMLRGKVPRDALAIVPRICGICSVTQSVAAARALATLAGVTPPPNGRIASDLILAVENLADHLTHFYLFFMPDFARPVYADRWWSAEVVRRFAAQTGEHGRKAVAARQRFMTLLGTLAGKWPHTMAIDPGGSARAIDAAERVRLAARLREFRTFVEQQMIGSSLARFNAISTEAELDAWEDEQPGQGDLRQFLAISRDLGLARLGIGPGLYLSHGGMGGGAPGGPVAGLWDGHAGQGLTFDPGDVTEDTSHAWLEDGPAPALNPREGMTVPLVDKPGAYSWNKAPRWSGRVVETGALARQLVAGHGLLHDVASRGGGNVHSRVLARFVEIAEVLPRMERWLSQLQPGEPFCQAVELPDQGEGVGLVEAARGALGHWLWVRQGRIANYQIVAPTSWNFSPRDHRGQPGALEAALVGTPVAEGERTPVAVQHVVRSFDPCMVCTVH
jgi:uptake hydrogenase large subunit